MSPNTMNRALQLSWRSSHLLVLMLTGLLLIPFQNARAVDKVYFVTDPNAHWNIAANWIPAGVPGPDDVAIFSAGSFTGCLIDAFAPVNVKGIRIDSGWLGTIDVFNEVTIGSAGYTQYSGTWNGDFAGNSMTVDINGPFTVTSGIYRTPNGTTEFGGSWDWQSSATSNFTQNGHIVFDGTSTALYNYKDGSAPPVFFDVDINRTNTWVLQIAPGKKFEVFGQLNLFDGALQSLGNDAEIWPHEDIYIASNFDINAKANLRMVGVNSATYTQDYNGSPFSRIRLDKDQVDDTVYFRSNNTSFISGSTSDSLFIDQATLVLADNAIHDFNFRYIELAIFNGRLNANPSGTWRVSSDIFCSMADPLLTFKNMGGTVEIDGFNSYIDIGTRFVFHNLTLNKFNTWTWTVQGSSILQVDNLMTFQDGRYNNGAGLNWIEARKDCTVESSYDPGSGRFRFNGPGNGTFRHNKTGLTFNNVVVEKTFSNDTIFVVDGSSSITQGSSSDTLSLLEGSMYWPDSVLADIDHGEVIIEAGATLINSKQKNRFSGNVNFNGGLYDANNSLWEFDGFNTTFSATPIPNFYNLELNKSNTWILTLVPGQIINIQNHLILRDGGYNGSSNSFLDIYKDCTVEGTFDLGTGKARFVGSSNAIFTHNRTGRSFNKVLIDKSGSASVSMTRTSGALNVGVSSDSLVINNGELNFIPTDIDLNYTHIIIENNGVLRAASGNSFCNSNFDNRGSFLHNNATWIWDGTNENTFKASSKTDFWNWTLNKSNTWRMFMTAGDTARVLNLAYFQDGGLVSNSYLGILEARKDIAIEPTYDVNNARVIMTGPDNGIFTHNRTGRTFFKIDVQKDSGSKISFTHSSGTPVMGDGADTLEITSGSIDFLTVDANFDYRRIDIRDGASMVAPGGTAFCQSNFNNEGSFDHNSGTWLWDGFNANSYTSNEVTEFFNWTLNKGNTWTLSINAGDTARVLNAAVFQDGGLISNSYQGIVEARKDVSVESTYDPNNGRVIMTGPENGIFTYNRTGRSFFKVDVRKNSGSKISITRTSGTPVIGDGSDTLEIHSGTLDFLTADANFDFRRIDIRSEGTLVAPSGTAFCQTDFNNEGRFDHNNGVWLWDGFNDKTYSSLQPTDFYDWTLNKGNTWRLKINAGDTARVRNKATFTDGALISNSYQGIVEAYGDVEVGSKYDVNSGRIIFTGDANTELLHDKTGQSFWRIDVRKQSGASLSINRSSGTLNIGSTADTLDLVSGVLNFTPDIADLNYRDINIHPDATLVAAATRTDCQSNFRHLGGNFDPNGASWRFDGFITQNFESTTTLDFNDVEMLKGSTWQLFLGSDTLRTQGALSLNDGALIGAVNPLNDVSIASTWDGITGELIFSGADTQHLSGVLDRIDNAVVLDKIGGEVILDDFFIVNGGGQIIDFRKGILRSSASSYVRFNDATSWTGASTLSYIAGPVRKEGSGNFTFPIGDGNRYAPARIESIISFSTFELEYQLESPDPTYPSDAGGPGVDHADRSQYWTVNRISGTSPNRLLLDSAAAWASGVNDADALIIVRWEADSSYWDTEGAAGFENGFLALAGSPGTLDGFGPVTFGSDNANNPLDNSSAICAKPTDLNASTTALGATLSWPDVMDAIGYQFEGENLGGPGSISIPISGSSLSSSSLQPCNPYRYRVQAVCADTTSPISDWLEFSTNGCSPCPIPDGLTVTSLTSNSAILQWNAIDSAIAYGLLGGPSGGPSAFLSTANNSLPVSGLSPGTSYEYSVAAWCGIDTSDFSASFLFSTPLIREAESNTGVYDLNALTLYPNPSTDWAMLKGLDPQQEYVINILDMQGKIRLSKQSLGQDWIAFDLSEIAAGQYILELTSAGQIDHKQRLNLSVVK